MRTDRDGAPLASVDAEDAAQRAEQDQVTSSRVDPTATLTPTSALAQAARLNRAAVNALDGERPEQAAIMAQVALSLTAYATATGRWQGR